MDFRRKFEFGLAWRTVALIGAILLVAKATATAGVRAGLVIAVLIAVLALASLWNFIRRTNFLVSRFIESVRFEDYSQRFTDPSGGGFDVLGETLDQALKTLQARHAQESSELALDGQDRHDRHRLVEPRHLGRSEDRLLRNAVEHQPCDLAGSRGQPCRRGQLRAQRFQVRQPVQRLAREQLAGRLVECLHPAFRVDREESTRRVVDDPR